MQVDKVTRWGDLESDEEESEEEEEEEEGESNVEGGQEGEGVADGTQSQVSGYGSSLPSGIETPDVLDLRKGKAAGAADRHFSKKAGTVLLVMPLARQVVQNVLDSSGTGGA